MFRRWRLVFVASILCLAGTVLAEPVELPVPDGVMPPEIPEANPPTRAKIDLGKKLYFDTRRSTDGTVACATFM